MSDQETLKQLTHCVSSEIRRKLFESTMGCEVDEESILNHLKRLCIKTQNRLVIIEPIAVSYMYNFDKS